MYYVFFATAFLCFLFHTMVHVLSYLGKLKENKATRVAIGVAMILAWFSYFYVAFNDTVMPMASTPLRYGGGVMVVIGIALFIVSHGKVHKRMHTGKGGLVTDGVYRYVRHPMYMGQILMLLGAPILGLGKLTLLLSPLLIVQILVWAYMEEKELMREFPEYAEYRKRTWF